MRNKKVLALLFAAALSFSMTAGAFAEEETASETNAAVEETAAETEEEASTELAEEDRLEALTGSYTELFGVLGAEENKSIWTDALQAYTTDEDEIELYYQMLTGSCMKEIYGQEAIDAYAENPDDAGFDCYFLHDLAELTIDGSTGTISGVDADGNELFSHTYHYVEDLPILYMGEEIGANHHIYESDDPDSGDFTYFAFADDTPDSTYHLEFRYGANEEDINNYTEGEYAYWNAAAFMTEYDDQTLTDVIQLFVTENMGE